MQLSNTVKRNEMKGICFLGGKGSCICSFWSCQSKELLEEEKTTLKVL